METTPLIFSINFSEDQFTSLDLIRNVLADAILDINEISVCNQKLLQVSLSQSVLDLKEIIKFRNIKGYRWNSYVLRMAILKLTYIIEVIILDDDEKHLILINDLKEVLKGLLYILEISYKEYWANWG